LDTIAPVARARLDRAMAGRTAPVGDIGECIARRDALLAAASSG